MKNIELKVPVENFEAVISALRKIKAKNAEVLHQVDTYYLCKSGCLKLRNTDDKQFELIFYQRQNLPKETISSYEILTIRPEQLKNIKSVLDEAFSKQVTVAKDRNLWLYKNTRIHLDSVNQLGKFLELETVVKGNKLKQAKSEFNQIVDLLDLSTCKPISISYSDLLLQPGNGL